MGSTPTRGSITRKNNIIKRFALDIEANALRNPTKIFCVVVEDIDSNDTWEFTDWNTFNTWFCKIDKCLFIGHNIIEYDAPILKKLWLTYIKEDQLIDTLVLSRLYSPKLEGGHSLEAWGQRLKFPKIEYNDFSKFTPEMLVYCKQDVALTKKLFKTLEKENLAPDAIKIEHEVAIALRDAKEYGFYFDVSKAIDLKIELEKERNKLDDIINEAYPPVETGKKIKKLVYFNPNSPKQVCDKLWEAGWKPYIKTNGHIEFDCGKWKDHADYYKKRERYEQYGWKICEENLSTLPDDSPEAAKCILLRTIIETRIRKLTEWLNLVDEDTGCIHGNIIGCGTWTHRMTHNNPNMANISAKKSIKYHTEELNKLATSLGGRMRALWIAKPGRFLVGTDAEGIQLRVLAHYMEDDEFTKAVTEGNKNEGTDPHSLNQKRIGRGTRDNAKTFIYAFLLGAGDGKVGEIYSISRREGAALKASYIDSTPGLKRLKSERIPYEAGRGFTTGFDGRRIECNSEHLMMAVYLQAGEAIIMKLAVTLAVKEIRRRKLDAHLINVVHDEMLFDCHWKHAYRVKLITEESIKKAGELLKLKCPMKGEGNVGRNWLEVH